MIQYSKNSSTAGWAVSCGQTQAAHLGCDLFLEQRTGLLQSLSTLLLSAQLQEQAGQEP